MTDAKLLATDLGSVLITPDLLRRNYRVADLRAENAALHSVAKYLSQPAEEALNHLLELALRLCSAGTAGISVLEIDPELGEIFRWNALAGELKQHVGGHALRHSSPCGVTIDRNSPQLFSYPGRYFDCFRDVKPEIVEGLVIPFSLDGVPIGTIWIVTHTRDVRFDMEDARIMTSLGEFSAAILAFSKLRQSQSG